MFVRDRNVKRISFLISKIKLKFRIVILKGPSQPPPFSMPSKLLILHGEAKSEFFTIGCAPESMFNYL